METKVLFRLIIILGCFMSFCRQVSFFQPGGHQYVNLSDVDFVGTVYLLQMMIKASTQEILLEVRTTCDIKNIPTGQAIKSLVYSSWTSPEKLITLAEYTESTVHMAYLPLSNNPRITSITSDAEKRTLYIYGPSIRFIYKISNFSGFLNETYSITQFKSGVSSVIANLALDRVADNLYWTDSVYDWIVMMSTRVSDQSMYRVIIQHDLHRPEAIAVDPDARYLFWSDTSEKNRLERSDLAGNDRKILIHKSMSRVLSIVTDSSNQRLYWVDNVRQTIESADYNGNDRRVLLRRNSVSMKSISLDGNDLYVTRPSNIIRYDKVSGLAKSSYNASDPFAIHVHGAESDSTTDACGTSGCSHMCVNNQNGPVCLCKEGYQLDSNGRTCSSKTDFYERGILFTDGVAICMLHIESITGLALPYLCRNLTSPLVGAITSGRTNLIFYDKIDNSIKSRPFANLGSSETLLTGVGSVKKLTYDWIDNVLFWIDNSSNSIKAYDVRISSSTIQLYTNLIDPDFLTIDPHEKWTFWIEGSSGNRKIMKGHMSASDGPSILVNSGSLSSPTGLFFDYSRRRLYFIDGGVVKSVLEDGTQLETYGAAGTGTILAVYKDYAVWTDGSRVLHKKTLESTSSSSSLTLTTISSVVDMTIHDSNLMQEQLGTCAIMNGGCEQICLPGISGPMCVCEHGFTLQSDSKTCSSTPMENEFALVNDYTHDKIYQISTDGQTIQALDIPDIRSSACAIFNPLDRKVYYAEISSGQIKSSSLYGTNRTTIYSPSLVNPDRLAIDLSTGYLYYTAVSVLPGIVYSYIGVIRLDTLVHKRLVDRLEYPRAVALHPSKGYIFWTDHGNTSHIGRAMMDGTSITIIASNNMRWPNGLAIDYTADRLYWTDGFYDKIESCDLSGGNRKELLTDLSAHLVDIIIKGAYLYYTGWSKQKVTKVEKSNGTQIPWMPEMAEFGRLDSIDFYPAEAQPENALCKSRNGECSTFCFARPQGRVCGCQDSVTLNTDGKTCSDVTVCPENIPNGRLESDCLRYQGERCNFTCNNGYTPKSGVSYIHCELVGRWNDEAVCEAIKCPSTFPNGNVSDSCNREIGSQCSYQCNSGFNKDNDITYLTCLSSGNWDRMLANLCTSNKCPSSFPNGNIPESCSRVVDSQCDYNCNDGFVKNNSIKILTCLSSKNWDSSLTSLCNAIDVRCPNTLPNGNFTEGCGTMVGTQCAFSCNEGYKKKEGITSMTCASNGEWSTDTSSVCIKNHCTDIIPRGKLDGCEPQLGVQCRFTCDEGNDKKDESVTFITCLNSGQWDRSENTLCIKRKVENEPSGNAAAIGGGAGGGGAVLLIVIIVIVVLYMRKRNASPYEDTRGLGDMSHVYNNPSCSVYDELSNVYEEIKMK